MSEDNNDTEPHAQPEITKQVNRGQKRSATEYVSVNPPKPRKRYAKRAEVWQHFVQREDDSSVCNCKYCGLEIGCDSKLAGTSSMKGHIGRCKLYKDFDEKEKQKVLSSDNKGNTRVVKYDPYMFRRSVNEMVVMNELPFTFVESEGWKRFCFNVLPLYKTFSRRTCCRDIVWLYEQKKIALKNMFRDQKQRVSLTTNIWTAPTTSCNYMVIRSHWINANWEMHKRILSFKVITDHRRDTISGQLLDCCEEWGIEKVFTVTVDNAKNNDKALSLFTDGLRMRGLESLVVDGELLHMRCCSHILNLIVGDGLKIINLNVVVVRNAVKYVRSYYTRLKSFAMRCATEKVSRGSLPLDVVTRWNSTYLMLNSAMKLRVAFDKMMLEDKLYCDYFLEEDEKTKRVGPPNN